MSLSEVQMAAALCEQVYRRADNDQQLDSSEDGNGITVTVHLIRKKWTRLSPLLCFHSN